MRCIEETVASVRCASAGELVVRQTKCDKTEIRVTNDRLGNAAIAGD